MGLAPGYDTAKVGADDVEFSTVFKVLWIGADVVADIFRCPCTDKGVFEARLIRGVKVDDAPVNVLFLNKVQ